MTAIVAYGAVSSLGRGRDAFAAAPIGERAQTRIAHDPKLASLARPYCARADAPERDRGAALLAMAMNDCVAMLESAVPVWRSMRIGLSLATSSGAMDEAEVLFRGEESPYAYGTTYFASAARVVSSLGVVFKPAALCLTACAASTWAMGLGGRWIEHDECDIVLAGGFDGVSLFVAAGFEALRATTQSPPPKPFSLGRDGMSLGEGAGIVALMREHPRAIAHTTGFGASSDGLHITAPDRTGGGLVRAAKAALAGRSVDLVSAHATATSFNDAAEARALAEVAKGAPVHAMKAQIGHTLGAAGVLETLACVDAIERSIVPATVMSSDLDPDAHAAIAMTTQAAHIDHALKLSAAFGGANAALVISRNPTRRANERRAVYVSRAVHVRDVPDVDKLAARTRQAPERLAKLDDLSRLAVFAVSSLEDLLGTLGTTRTGIAVGHAMATTEHNARYYGAMRTKGPKMADPRAFPYTSPNAAAGECSVAHGLLGPSLAVGFGFHGGLEALAVAAEIVASDDADAMVVVSCDRERGGMCGAVATLVSREPKGALVTKWQTELKTGSVALSPGHLALLPLVTEFPERLCSISPTGRAEVHLRRI